MLCTLLECAQHASVFTVQALIISDGLYNNRCMDHVSFFLMPPVLHSSDSIPVLQSSTPVQHSSPLNADTRGDLTHAQCMIGGISGVNLEILWTRPCEMRVISTLTLSLCRYGTGGGEEGGGGGERRGEEREGARGEGREARGVGKKEEGRRGKSQKERKMKFL